MYIPDGFLQSQIWIVFYALMSVLWLIALKRVLSNRKLVPILIITSGFSFALMMFKMPIAGGTTGHLIGATFLSIILGPWASFTVITLSLGIQAFLFGDGGITSFAANSFTIGFVASFSGYYIYEYISKYIFKNLDLTPEKISIAAGIGAYFSLISAALVTVFILGAQPILNYVTSDAPFNFPYPLTVSICALLIENLIVFGWVEGVITGIAINLLIKGNRPFLNILSSSTKL